VVRSSPAEGTAGELAIEVDLEQVRAIWVFLTGGTLIIDHVRAE
jgi:hypothetical protein